MSVMPKVSVIVPVYNTEKYLKKCISSLLSQTLKDIEIICVNDGSTDESLRVLKRFARNDPRIIIIDKKNEGYGKAINVGIDNANADFIGVVDSDDYVSACMYGSLYDTALCNNAEIVKSNYYEVKSRAKKILKKKISCTDNPSLYNKLLNPSIDRVAFYYKTMNIWTGLYSKALIKNNHIKANESPGASFQDNGFWFQIMLTGKRAFFLDRYFYHYRKDNPDSSIHDKNKAYNIFDEFRFIRDFFVSDPDKYKSFFDIYVTQKYYVYLHHYLYVSEQNKMDFLRRAADEFRDDLEELGDACTMLDHDVLGEMARIIDSPEIYYYESTIDILNEKLDKVKKTCEILNSSHEYRKMITLRKIRNTVDKILKR